MRRVALCVGGRKTTDTGTPDAGDALFRMITQREWISRRSETVTFIDDVRIRRAVALLIDPDRIPGGVLGPQVLPLPLTIMEKHPFRDIVTRDAHGSSLSTLTKRQNSKLSAEAAQAGFLRAGVSRSGDIPDRTTLEQIALSPPHTAEELLNQLDNGDLGDGDAMKLLKLLVHHFVMYVPLDPATTTFVHYEYEQELFWSRRQKPFLSRLPSTPTPIILPVAGLTPERSSHVVIEPPEGVAVDAAVLVAEAEPAQNACKQAESPAGSNFFALDATPRTTRAHLFSTGISGASPTAAVWIRPVKRRLARQVMLYCLAVTLFTLMSITLTLWPLDVPNAGEGSAPVETVRGSADVSVILAIAGLIAVLPASSKELPLVSLIVRDFRLAALASGTLATIWALLLASTSSRGFLRLIALVIGFGMVALLILVLISYLMCIRKRTMHVAGSAAPIESPLALPTVLPAAPSPLHRVLTLQGWETSDDMYSLIHDLTRGGAHSARAEEERLSRREQEGSSKPTMPTPKS